MAQVIIVRVFRVVKKKKKKKNNDIFIQAGGKVIATQTRGHLFSAHPRENPQRAPESENRDVADMAAVTSCSPVRVMCTDRSEIPRRLQ